MPTKPVWQSLLPLRLAVKGWAFTADKSLPSKLARAEEILAALPEDAKAEGERLIEGFRDHVTRV